ncbi:pimeloyl-ACP methyl ester carboxylesterase [Kineothrix alysoides]|uniref:Pimeloyl-ACP methyl ester carboxylesterase n=1 Tax=Kineothrix alysoides TaxID=1469948 RepID=A0A4R1QLF9_9FIRM|nr:alpha/beta hydrolase [Kineothrix alysoides]TCL54466.1 pimeloyl-ACP methyl ester carboxylesterase [Kineothrix alysoides]
MREFIHQGLKLEYEVSGTGIPFLFLHGMGGSTNQIHSTYQPSHDIQLIAMNQQGHGGSEMDREHLDFNRLGDDAISLLDHLHIEKAYLAGISMGAAVSLNAASRYHGRIMGLLLIRNAWTDKPMSDEVRTAYRDLGMSLKSGGPEAFYRTEGWNIVKECSSYTKQAFLSPFFEPASVKNWQKYLILPDKAPVASLTDLTMLNIPVTILANRNDLCHPYEYGEYLHTHIPGSAFVEIPDKDGDKAEHNAMINQALRSLLHIST